MVKFSVEKHSLVPKHSKLTKEEAQQVLEQYNVTLNELPRISKADPAVGKLGAKADDIIKIERPSPTAGTALFFRRVADD